MSARAQDAVGARIDALMVRDREALQGLRRAIARREAAGLPVSVLRGKLGAHLEQAERRLAERRAWRPLLNYPDTLPISAERERILEALAASQVLIVCGDTGSGKTTQLPKLCLEAGRGVRGLIGHTQPRRIAARAAAVRLAEELGAELGAEVGYKVRFDDTSRPSSLIKVMTDGVLLNEIREDPALAAYDTLIVDEAHERSLNIDFLIGYLKQLLPRRPDLKLIVTSATIDPARFAAHFDGAPVLHVEGRSYPVEYRYRPLCDGQELTEGIVAAVDELDRMDAATPGGGAHGDILVFLPGERWIRDAEQALRRAGFAHYEILPLYARLPAARQQRIFNPGKAPRIVLATNVAETSLTVPRIRFVIDSGLARVSRYLTRHRVQRLGVEPIARANADQRAGRCGRLAAGVCMRLFSEEDYTARPRFADPEISRTDLAGVILQLEAMRLGRVEEFPFLDAPPSKSVNDAYRLLHVLGALDADRRLTEDGAVMGRLPLDPRLARLLIGARDNGSLREALVLAAGLSIIDPREQPVASLEAARRAQREFQDLRSDFVTLLNLWRAWRAERRRGRKVLRDWSQRKFVSLARMNEWQDVHQQLCELVDELGWKRKDGSADYRRLHEAVLAAFVDFVAQRDDGPRYRGMHEAKAMLFPGTPLAQKRPRWLVAAEHVATEHAYLRTVAQIDPRWVLQVAPHLIKRDYRDPVWDRKSGRVLAREVVSLFGLTVSAKRRIDFAGIDAAEARRIFIDEALARDELGAESGVLEHNRVQRRKVLDWEARIRSRDLFVGERALAAFYAERLPLGVADRKSFLRCCADEDCAAALRMSPEDLATRDIDRLDASRYPETIEIAGQALKLGYCYEPGNDADGVTVYIPSVLLGSVRAEHLEWLIPGWLEEKVTALLRTLPKAQRRRLVPLPDAVRRLLGELERRAGRQALLPAVCEVLALIERMHVRVEEFAPERLAPHLSMRVQVVDASAKTIAGGRDFARLARRYTGSPANALSEVEAAQPWSRRGVRRWSIPDLPDVVRVEQYGRALQLYPALIDERGRVDLCLLPPGPAAVERHRLGVRRLLLECLPQQVALIDTTLRKDHALLLAYHGIGNGVQLVDDVVLAAAECSFDLGIPIRRAEQFEACLAAGRADLVAGAQRCRALLDALLPRYRRLSARLATASMPADARADITAQLGELVYPYFLSRTPVECLAQLPRYLQAIETRVEKLRGASAKDAAQQRRVEEAWGRLRDWRLTWPSGWPVPGAMCRYRWMIEEYRVSLFAQALGTAVPVSVRRLDEAWRAALAETAAMS